MAPAPAAHAPGIPSIGSTIRSASCCACFVTARPDARDRRRPAIALTDTGRAVAEAAVKVARQITRHTLVPLTAAEQRAEIWLLRKLA